jgi:prepilin-type N-terminal cleavage/methylation domain-containing protein/prepilin-type processing-associated H-X9-DG protein
MIARRTPPRGFTLIELLVVIAIIGLLISLLLPVLAGARSSARTLKCASQLRSVCGLTAAFMAEHKEQAPIAGRLWNHTVAAFTSSCLPDALAYYTEAGAGSTLRPMPFFACLAEFSGLELDRSSIQTMRSQLGFPGAEAGLAESFFAQTRCPDDATFDREDLEQIGNTLLPNDLSWTVSGGLGEMSSYMLNEWALGESPETTDRLLGKLYKVQHPSEVSYSADGEPRILEPPLGINYLLYFDDETRRGYTMADYNEYYRASSPPEQCSRGIFYQFGFTVNPQTGAVIGRPRHGSSVNVAFVDGHVRAAPLSDEGLSRVLISDP